MVALLFYGCVIFFVLYFWYRVITHPYVEPDYTKKKKRNLFGPL